MTASAAELLGMQDKVGTIEPGNSTLTGGTGLLTSNVTAAGVTWNPQTNLFVALNGTGAAQFDALNLVGPAGYVSMEDGAVGNFVQRAIKGGEDEYSILEMGGHEHTSQETRTTEASIRGFWQAYRPLMGL